MNPEWQVNENYTLLKKGDFQIVFFKLFTSTQNFVQSNFLNLLGLIERLDHDFF